jgi:hypothetical protein
VLAAAFAFGLVAAAAQGNGGGEGIPELRNTLVHLSTPWLLVAFVAGTRCSTLRSGALLGFGATMAALVGFYLLASVVQDLGGHGFVGDLRLELTANWGYIQGGIVTGPLFGALGAWWARSRELHASVVAGVLLMAEPIVLVLIAALGSNEVLPADSGLP